MATKTNTKITSKKGKEYKYARITRVIGHEWKDGKKVPITKQFTAPSKTTAIRKYEEWKEAQRKLKKDNVLETCKTAGQLMDFYADNVLAVSSDFANSTKTLYLGAYERFKRKDTTEFLKLPIQSVTAAQVQLTFNQLAVPHSTMKNTYNFFNHFFKWASLNQYCEYVLMPVTIPRKPLKKKKEGIVVWSDEEFEMITQALHQYREKYGHDYRLRFFIFFSYYTGLRISESLGMQYPDITDFVAVRRQFYRGEITAPKYNSFRDIPAHRTLLDEFEIHKAWHEKEMRRNKYKTDFIFTTPAGTHLDYANVRKALAKFYKENEIPYKAPHTYRATFCTNLCRQETPLEVASKLMGHKSVEVTAKYYTFVDDQSKIDAINKL